MKTLDEVIKAWEFCPQNPETCQGCPYQYDSARTEDCYKDDALYYLKKYRDNFEARNDQVTRYQKAAKDCEEILTDYVALKQYWSEQQENPPLTWDELKTMEGKPVWVVFTTAGKWRYDYGEWIIITYIDDYELIDNDDYGFYPQKSYGTEWQAYRKERG